MKSENPVTYNLRFTTAEIINEMYVSGKYLSLKEACFDFFKKAKRKRLNTGFKLSEPQKFYDCIRQFYSKNHKKSQNKSTQNEINTIFEELSN